MSDDGGFVVSDPNKQGALARRRQREALARNPRNTVDVKREHFKATCPWCHATNVVMSEIAPSLPSTTPPEPGDIIKCDHCRRHHAIAQVNLDGRCKTFPVEVQHVVG